MVRRKKEPELTDDQLRNLADQEARALETSFRQSTEQVRNVTEAMIEDFVRDNPGVSESEVLALRQMVEDFEGNMDMLANAGSQKIRAIARNPCR